MLDSRALVEQPLALAARPTTPPSTRLPLVQREARAHGIARQGERCASDDCGFAASCNTPVAYQLLRLTADAEIRPWPFRAAAAGRVVGALVVSGAGPLVHRVDHERLGGSDESCCLHHDDIGLCARAGEAGMPMVVEPGSHVSPPAGHSAGRSAERLRTALLRGYDSDGGSDCRGTRSTRGYGAVRAAAQSVVFPLHPGTRPRACRNEIEGPVAGRASVRGGPSKPPGPVT